MALYQTPLADLGFLHPDLNHSHIILSHNRLIPFDLPELGAHGKLNLLVVRKNYCLESTHCESSQYDIIC